MPRADLILVQQGLAASRTQAQRLIDAGCVQFQDAHGNWHSVQKAHQTLPDNGSFRLTDNDETRYVSRGGLKLEGALCECRLNISGMACLDVGQSTGGFTDCLLQHGAASVIGVDVGHSQLHPRLRNDPRITCIEKVNARELPDSLCEHNAGNAFDLAVMDVSFISQTLILPSLATLIKPGGFLLSLVKPQFEAGQDYLNKQGIIKNSDAYTLVEQRIRDACATAQLDILDYFPSSITGGDGNREFFVYCRKQERRQAF